MAVILKTDKRTSTVTISCKGERSQCPYQRLCNILRNREESNLNRQMALSQLLLKGRCRITIVETNMDGIRRMIHPRIRKFNLKDNAAHPMLKEGVLCQV